MTMPAASAPGDTALSTSAYRPGRPTPCPSCGERRWLVGRVMAECAGCETALPLERGYRGWTGAGAFQRHLA